jgi:hypothetical protein
MRYNLPCRMENYLGLPSWEITIGTCALCDILEATLLSRLQLGNGAHVNTHQMWLGPAFASFPAVQTRSSSFAAHALWSESFLASVRRDESRYGSGKVQRAIDEGLKSSFPEVAVVVRSPRLICNMCMPFNRALSGQLGLMRRELGGGIWLIVQFTLYRCCCSLVLRLTSS